MDGLSVAVTLGIRPLKQENDTYWFGWKVIQCWSCSSHRLLLRVFTFWICLLRFCTLVARPEKDTCKEYLRSCSSFDELCRRAKPPVLHFDASAISPCVQKSWLCASFSPRNLDVPHIKTSGNWLEGWDPCVMFKSLQPCYFCPFLTEALLKSAKIGMLASRYMTLKKEEKATYIHCPGMMVRGGVNDMIWSTYSSHRKLASNPTYCYKTQLLAV